MDFGPPLAEMGFAPLIGDVLATAASRLSALEFGILPRERERGFVEVFTRGDAGVFLTISFPPAGDPVTYEAEGVVLGAPDDLDQLYDRVESALEKPLHRLTRYEEELADRVEAATSGQTAMGRRLGEASERETLRRLCSEGMAAVRAALADGTILKGGLWLESLVSDAVAPFTAALWEGPLINETDADVLTVIAKRPMLFSCKDSTVKRGDIDKLSADSSRIGSAVGAQVSAVLVATKLLEPNAYSAALQHGVEVVVKDSVDEITGAVRASIQSRLRASANQAVGLQDHNGGLIGLVHYLGGIGPA